MCARYFEALGFRAETVRGGPDGGVDVHLYTKDSLHPAIVVQCKAWRSGAVGVAVVRELLGVMTAAGVKEGVIATTSTFTADAKSFAMGKEIHHIEGEDLVRKLRDLAPERQKSLIECQSARNFDHLVSFPRRFAPHEESLLPEGTSYRGLAIGLSGALRATWNPVALRSSSLQDQV